MMTDQLATQSEAPVGRLAVVETEVLDDRIPLLVSSNQLLFAQVATESTQEFSSRFVKRATSLPPARMGLLLLGDDDNFDARWSILLALAARLKTAPNPELVISVRSGSGSELVGWELLERATQGAFFRGIQLRLQFAEAQAAPPAPSSSVRLARPKPPQLSRKSA